MDDDEHVVYDIPPRYARLIHVALGLAGTAMTVAGAVAVHCLG